MQGPSGSGRGVLAPAGAHVPSSCLQGRRAKEAFFSFCLRLFSPDSHRWQNGHPAASEQPLGLWTNAQGLQSPSSWPAEPADGGGGVCAAASSSRRSAQQGLREVATVAASFSLRTATSKSGADFALLMHTSGDASGTSKSKKVFFSRSGTGNLALRVVASWSPTLRGEEHPDAVVLALALPGRDLKASGRSPWAARRGTKGLAEPSSRGGDSSVRGVNGLASIRERRLVRLVGPLAAAAGNGRRAAAALRRARGIP